MRAAAKHWRFVHNSVISFPTCLCSGQSLSVYWFVGLRTENYRENIKYNTGHLNWLSVINELIDLQLPVCLQTVHYLLTYRLTVKYC